MKKIFGEKEIEMKMDVIAPLTTTAHIELDRRRTSPNWIGMGGETLGWGGVKHVSEIEGGKTFQKQSIIGLKPQQGGKCMQQQTGTIWGGNMGNSVEIMPNAWLYTRVYNGNNGIEYKTAEMENRGK